MLSRACRKNCFEKKKMRKKSINSQGEITPTSSSLFFLNWYSSCSDVTVCLLSTGKELKIQPMITPGDCCNPLFRNLLINWNYLKTWSKSSCLLNFSLTVVYYWKKILPTYLIRTLQTQKHILYRVTKSSEHSYLFSSHVPSKEIVTSSII